MHLFTKITFLVLCILATMIGFDLLQMQKMIANYDQSLKEQTYHQVKDIVSKISREIELLKKNAINLASISEVSRAIIQVDNEVLSSWGRGVLGNCDIVLFADLEGRVLARIPDEFRFGDILVSSGHFLKSEKAEIFTGASEIDGQPSLFATVPVYQYNDVQVGTAILAINITPTFLSRLVGNASIQFQVRFGNTTVATPRPPGKRLNSYDLPQLLQHTSEPVTFEIALHADKRYERLIKMKNSIFIRGVIAVVFLIGLCSFFLHRYLRPHARLISLIGTYEYQSSCLQEFRNKLFSLQRKGDQDIKNISAAIIHMVETLERARTDLEQKACELELANNRLEKLSITDFLTGLANRRRFDEVLGLEWARAGRVGEPLALIMIDIDHFKKFNDRYGHQAGDECLKKVAFVLKGNLGRAGDLVARYGGEEFGVISAYTDHSRAQVLAEKIRRSVEDLALVHEDSTLGIVTISLGIAVDSPEKAQSADDLVRAADTALYEAKTSGRNCIKYCSIS